MPEDSKKRGHWEYKLYRVRAPRIASTQELVDATEQKLLADLRLMDSAGWEIAEVFPGGTHFLMKRERPDWARWQPGDKEPEERDVADTIQPDPQEQQPKESGQ